MAAHIKSAPICSCIAVAVLLVVSSEIQIARGNKIFDDCLVYCKNDFKKDAFTCWIWCTMRCMPSLGNDCIETGNRRYRVTPGEENADEFGRTIRSIAEPPTTADVQEVAQSPLPEFLESMNHADKDPLLKEYLDELTANANKSPAAPPASY